MRTQGLPEPLQKLVAELTDLPGLGPKSALRMALTLLKWPRARACGLGQAIVALRETMNLCQDCGALSDADRCHICADPTRNRATICLVAEWDSLLALEEGGFYRGVYLILGGLYSPMDADAAAHLELDRLRDRLGDAPEELILALGTTAEAENTASYVKRLVEAEFPRVRVSRLAQGMPLGADVKYMDKETLKQSLLWRQGL